VQREPGSSRLPFAFPHRHQPTTLELVAPVGLLRRGAAFVDNTVAVPPNSDIDDARARRIAVCGAESAESVEVGARQTSEVAETSFMKNAVSAELPS